MHTAKASRVSLSQRRVQVVRYKRVPLTPEAAPEARDFDAVRTLLLAWRPTDGPIVFADQNGRGRATVAVLSVLVMAHYTSVISLPVPPDAAEMCAQSTIQTHTHKHYRDRSSIFA